MRRSGNPVKMQSRKELEWPMPRRSAGGFSSDPADKVHACLNHNEADAGVDLPPQYIAACKRWFERLSPSERKIVSAVTTAHELHDEASAAEIAAALPAAPKFPLGE